MQKGNHKWQFVLNCTSRKLYSTIAALRSRAVQLDEIGPGKNGKPVSVVRP